MIEITVNGDQHKVDKNVSLVAFLESLRLDSKKVAVERNREIVSKSTYEICILEDKDVLEIVHFIGGGE